VIFETEVMWSNFEEHVQIKNWLAKSKHLKANFSDIHERNVGSSKFSDFYRKKI
jgi:hypothetical protein